MDMTVIANINKIKEKWYQPSENIQVLGVSCCQLSCTVKQELNERIWKQSKLFNAMKNSFIIENKIPKSLKVQVLKKVQKSTDYLNIH